MASNPEPQMRLTLRALTELGRPARRAARRAAWVSSSVWPTQPMITWSTWSGFTPALSRAAFMTTLPRSTAGTSTKLPPKRPMGVLAPETITVSSIKISLLFVGVESLAILAAQFSGGHQAAEDHWRGELGVFELLIEGQTDVVDDIQPDEVGDGQRPHVDAP